MFTGIRQAQTPIVNFVRRMSASTSSLARGPAERSIRQKVNQITAISRLNVLKHNAVGVVITTSFYQYPE